MSESSRDLARVNAGLAARYDLVPYDPQKDGYGALDPALVFGVAGLHGDFPLRRNMDVLDLGCGTGSQLVRVGRQAVGRLVGADLSRHACDVAVERCAEFGDRATILCSDLLDLTPERLGTFDLIYLIGVIYVVPADVQRHLLALTAACLKPGGVAVMSYYSGAVARTVVTLRGQLQAVVTVDDPPAEQIRAARARLAQIAWTLPPGGGSALKRVVDHAASCNDATFFHEMLDAEFTTVSTIALEAALAPAGVHFLNWMAPAVVDAATTDARMAILDAAEERDGGYHYALFGKGEVSPSPHFPPAILWQTRLRPAGQAPSGAAVFQDLALGQQIEVPHPDTAAALERLAAGPLDWSAMSAGIADTATLRKDMLSLWHHGLAQPLAAV